MPFETDITGENWNNQSDEPFGGWTIGGWFAGILVDYITGWNEAVGNLTSSNNLFENVLGGVMNLSPVATDELNTERERQKFKYLWHGIMGNINPESYAPNEGQHYSPGGGAERPAWLEQNQQGDYQGNLGDITYDPYAGNVGGGGTMGRTMGQQLNQSLYDEWYESQG